ncbi:MAG: MBL fold metallo-hydrolase [Clostridia bacterium]|nr:MBL fold metallo-hydrolase [Clostridia bacterium]
MKTVIHQLRTMEKPLDGMSYVIQCSDSSVLVVDGGMDQGDAEKLIGFLKKITGKAKPVIDAWFITHNHADHTFCFMDVAEHHADEVEVKKLVVDFLPESFYVNAQPISVPQLRQFDADTALFAGMERVRPRSGDIYNYGDTKIEILYTASDLPVVNGGKGMAVNDTSLVFRVRAEGQTVLFLGDVQDVGDGVMIKKYGKALKSDVCQVAHHGYWSSTIEFYEYVDPSILLWPVNKNTFDQFIHQIRVDRHLVCNMRVKDIYLAGLGDFSLEMPIQPREKPFTVRVEDVPDRELIPDAAFVRADTAPTLDPADPAWNASRLYEAKFDLWPNPGPEGDSGTFKALWDEDSLYLNIRFSKKLVSDPHHFGSADSDCVRLYLTEIPVAGRFDFWEDHPGDPRFIENIKYFPEKKLIGGREVTCTDLVRCDSAIYPDADGYTVCARVKFSQKHKAGDVIGFDLEFNGVRSPGAIRAYSLNFVNRESFFMHQFTPSALAYVILE